MLALIYLYAAEIPCICATQIPTYSFFSVVVVDNYGHDKMVVEKSRTFGFCDTKLGPSGTDNVGGLRLIKVADT